MNPKLKKGLISGGIAAAAVLVADIILSWFPALKALSAMWQTAIRLAVVALAAGLGIAFLDG